MVTGESTGMIRSENDGFTLGVHKPLGVMHTKRWRKTMGNGLFSTSFCMLRLQEGLGKFSGV